jgi:uncharacterized protein
MLKLSLIFFSLFLLPAAAAEQKTEATRNRAPLAGSAFYPLPLTTVKPRGWLRDQLRIQSEGITGHLDEFWPDVGKNSAWLGGTGEGWERGPYYLDGLVPLAYLLDDPRLIAKVKPWVEWTLTHQRPDGGIGPAKNRDWWPIMIMLKALTQYHEATGDARVIPVMEKYFAYQSSELAANPLQSWAIYRWQDELASILWLYNRNGDPKLLDLARQLQSKGFDWRKWFEPFQFAGRVPRERAKLDTHGVNNAMGLKTAALWSLVSRDGGDRAATANMIAALDKFEGLPNGMFSADEHYAGRNPSQGIELCAVVETLFSLAIDASVLGDAWIGDRMEKIAYNPLPGGQTADQWGHQYDQQPNQVMCSLARRDWTTNGPESNVFGLEPNFGCCTANLHQGWPKFAASLWMASADGGLAVIAYAPSQVHTKINGADVVVEETTGYPFRDRISLAVTTGAKVRFPLHLRVPAWANEASITVNGMKIEGVRGGAYSRIEREWRTGDRVEITLPMKVRAVRGFNESVSVERGPLVFSLRIGESWSRLKQTGPVTDWEVFPASPWNYGLHIDAANPAAAFEVKEAPIMRQPFLSANPPVVLTAKARRLAQWMIVNDSAAPPPVSPVVMKVSEDPAARPKDYSVTLIPYGAARLRITSFPVLGPDEVQVKKK